MTLGLIQTATPLARVLSPGLLDRGGWGALSLFELGALLVALGLVARMQRRAATFRRVAAHHRRMIILVGSPQAVASCRPAHPMRQEVVEGTVASMTNALLLATVYRMARRPVGEIECAFSARFGGNFGRTGSNRRRITTRTTPACPGPGGFPRRALSCARREGRTEATSG